MIFSGVYAPRVISPVTPVSAAVQTAAILCVNVRLEATHAILGCYVMLMIVSFCSESPVYIKKTGHSSRSVINHQF